MGCIRNFNLKDDGGNIREQLLAHSDIEHYTTYSILESPMPVENYVATIKCSEITDGNRTFWEWESRFDTPAGRQDELGTLVGEGIYQAGFEAIRQHMGLAA